jgi:hypothetical protein
MAQNALTCTPPNPSPPHNFSCVGATPPHDPLQPQADDGTPGAGTAFAAKTAAAGAGTSVDAEGKGTEVVVTQSYPATIYNPAGPLVTFSDLGNYVGLSPTSGGATTATPNQQHASSLSPATNPALVSISPTSTASGVGNFALTATGTNLTKQSVIYVNGVAQACTYAGLPTSVLATSVVRKATAGTWNVTVVTGGVVTTAPQTLSFT